LTSGSTPVPSQFVFEIGVNSLGKRHADHGVIVNAMAGDRLRFTSRGLPNDGGSLQHLEVIAELLRARKTSGTKLSEGDTDAAMIHLRKALVLSGEKTLVWE
jgi:hypothetical protein